MADLPPLARVVATWLGIVPVALVAQLLLAPILASVPSPLALLATVTVAVPIAVLWTVPLAMRAVATLRRRPKAATR